MRANDGEEKRWKEDDRNGANKEKLRERQPNFSPAATGEEKTLELEESDR